MKKKLNPEYTFVAGLILLLMADYLSHIAVRWLLLLLPENNYAILSPSTSPQFVILAAIIRLSLVLFILALGAIVPVAKLLGSRRNYSFFESNLYKRYRVAISNTSKILTVLFTLLALANLSFACFRYLKAFGDYKTALMPIGFISPIIPLSVAFDLLWNFLAAIILAVITMILFISVYRAEKQTRLRFASNLAWTLLIYILLLLLDSLSKSSATKSCYLAIWLLGSLTFLTSVIIRSKQIEPARQTNPPTGSIGRSTDS